MSLPLLMASITAITFLWRFTGLSVSLSSPSPFWAQFLRFMPISIFAALTVSAMFKDASLMNPKLLALAISGVIAWKSRQMGLSILCGLLVLWIFVWLGVQ